MTDIKFSDAEKAPMVQKVKRYFKEELDQDIGAFEAEFLIDFFATEVGSFFYNRGLYDAQTVLAGKLEELTDSILDLEKPIQQT